MLCFLLHYHHHQFRDFLCLFLRPPVIKLDKAISILDLIPLLPKAAFLTGFSSEGEVFIFKKKKDISKRWCLIKYSSYCIISNVIFCYCPTVCLGGLYLSVYELVLLEAEKAESFSRFLQELKKIHLVSSN